MPKEKDDFIRPYLKISKASRRHEISDMVKGSANLYIEENEAFKLFVP